MSCDHTFCLLLLLGSVTQFPQSCALTFSLEPLGRMALSIMPFARMTLITMPPGKNDNKGNDDHYNYIHENLTK